MPPRQQYEVERIVAQRCRNKQTEYRVRWRGWRAADDTWESATTLQREVPTGVHAFLAHRALRGAFGRGCKPRRRCSRAAASVLVQAQARAAALPSSAHQELFDLMRRQFPATSSNDTAQIICESQCVLVMQHGHGHAVSAGACVSYDDDEGYLHFLAADVRGQRHGTMLLHAAACFLKQVGVKRLRLDSQLPDGCDSADAPAPERGREKHRETARGRVRGRGENDPVAFYRACGCQEEAQPSTGRVADDRPSVPMVGSVNHIILQCSSKLGTAPQQPHVTRLLTGRAADADDLGALRGAAGGGVRL
jgi:hypothetical protein